TFNPGETVKYLTVLVNGDTADETDESFSLNLSNPTNINLDGSVGTGVIQNDEVSVSFTSPSQSQAEGNSGSTTMVFNVGLSTASSHVVTVNYDSIFLNRENTSNIYKLDPGVLTFAPGETSKQITATILGDTTYEPDDQFQI